MKVCDGISEPRARSRRALALSAAGSGTPLGQVKACSAASLRSVKPTPRRAPAPSVSASCSTEPARSTRPSASVRSPVSTRPAGRANGPFSVAAIGSTVPAGSVAACAGRS
ncbi:Uncharacterised protein [Achromobacter sp. 2789STDY5608615]|nr:Uncharacterised protein [Achromobacter sp. 2789STDY5608615]